MHKSIVIPYPDKLSEHMSELPFGSIKKSATGMGATHLELFISKRNSIVVAPLLAITESKKHPLILTVDGTTTYGEFYYYMQECTGFKKIHCSAASIRKLFEYFFRLEVDPEKDDYFFLIDEIDLFQTQADFRENLSDAIDNSLFIKMSKNKTIFN